MSSNPGVRLGGAVVENTDSLMTRAVEISRDADVVIVVVGLNSDWETEGYDRKTIALPGRTDELISKVAAVNSKVVVVTQSVSGALHIIFLSSLLRGTQYLLGICDYYAMEGRSLIYRSRLVSWQCVW